MLKKLSVYTFILLISVMIGGFNQHNVNQVVYAASENNIVQIENEEVKAPAEKIIDGETFIKLEENEQLQTFINIANQYEANAYGLPNTDIILIIKDDEILLSSSAGSAAATTEYTDVLKDFIAIDEISEDIETVLQTGEDINKMNDDFTGYYIGFDGQWVSVQY